MKILEICLSSWKKVPSLNDIRTYSVRGAIASGTAFVVNTVYAIRTSQLCEMEQSHTVSSSFEAAKNLLSQKVLTWFNTPFQSPLCSLADTSAKASLLFTTVTVLFLGSWYVIHKYTRVTPTKIEDPTA